MSVPVVLALGGNLGDVRATGKSAISQLNETPGIVVEQVSRWYSTEPVGCEGRFLNAAARVQSELTPGQLLSRLLDIEARHGRVRTGHWTPRPLDMDLIAFGNWQVDHPRLRVPHPAAWYRRFVLDPVCEVAGSLEHPGLGQTFDALRSRLLVRPLTIFGGESVRRDEELAQSIRHRFGSRVQWADSGERCTAAFVPLAMSSGGRFEIELPDDLAGARRVVLESLTAMLDEPCAVAT